MSSVLRTSGTKGQRLVSSSPRAIDILGQLKSLLAARGVRGIVAVQRRFRIMDDDNTGTISFPEFQKASKECGLQISDEVSNFSFVYFLPFGFLIFL